MVFYLFRLPLLKQGAKVGKKSISEARIPNGFIKAFSQR